MTTPSWSRSVLISVPRSSGRPERQTPAKDAAVPGAAEAEEAGHKGRNGVDGSGTHETRGEEERFERTYVILVCANSRRLSASQSEEESYAVPTVIDQVCEFGHKALDKRLNRWLSCSGGRYVDVKR